VLTAALPEVLRAKSRWVTREFATVKGTAAGDHEKQQQQVNQMHELKYCNSCIEGSGSSAACSFGDHDAEEMEAHMHEKIEQNTVA
jgi:hypothetical protein